MQRPILAAAAALALLALPAAAQDYDCPPDVAADSPRCVPAAGLAAQVYAIGDRLSEEIPVEAADRADMPPLRSGEGFAEHGGKLMRVRIEDRTILDVLDVEGAEDAPD
ncbi:hypothetical protein [Jannaschia sp. W003]|uniref:hypothetical protein n=1 Tax=Jannaschia sp. W003 TaxID=2867012 RepID=UPI0021A4F696|nr:hypothetical protein [Jannaschia sp. W003]UWQ20732.1 hypothetical protein K3554_12190 [Jannaschia sp. W003]